MVNDMQPKSRNVNQGRLGQLLIRTTKETYHFGHFWFEAIWLIPNLLNRVSIILYSYNRGLIYSVSFLNHWSHVNSFFPVTQCQFCISLLANVNLYYAQVYLICVVCMFLWKIFSHKVLSTPGSLPWLSLHTERWMNRLLFGVHVA